MTGKGGVFLFCFLFFSACNDLKLCSRRVYFLRLLVCKIKSDCSIDAVRCKKKKKQTLNTGGDLESEVQKDL